MKKRIKGIRQQIRSKTQDLTYSYGYHLENSDIRSGTILLESFHGKTVSDSPFVCAQEIERLYPGRYRLYFASGNVRAHAELLEHAGIDAELLDIGSERYAEVLATAEYIISNASLPAFYIRREGQKYLQTWHGTPLKTLGKQMREGIESMYNVQHNFLQASHILFPNEFTRDAVMRDYNLKKLYTGKTLMCGYPRNRIFFDRKAAAELRSRLGTEDKTVYAYMPTWRGTSNRDIENDSYFEEVRDIFDRLDSRMSDEQLMYVGFHPIIAGSFSFDGYRHIRPFPQDVNNYELLNSADALVTDYSSVFFDYAVTGKPVILFMYDYERYMRDRGMYLDVRELPFRRVYDTESFCSCIAGGRCLSDDYSGSGYLQAFLRYDSADCTERLLRYFLGGDESLLETEDYSYNCSKRINVILPDRVKSRSDLEALARLTEGTDDAVLLYRKWFGKNSGIGQLLHDEYNDRLNYVIASDSPPRTRQTDIKAMLGSAGASEHIRGNEIARCFPGLDIDAKRGELRSDVALLRSVHFDSRGFRAEIFLRGWDAGEINGCIIRLDDSGEIIRARTETRQNRDGCMISMSIDYADAKFRPIRWQCMAEVRSGGSLRLLRIRAKGRRLRYMFRAANIQSRLENGFILFPYIGGGGLFKLCYREDNGYDNGKTRLKELTALALYTMRRKSLRRKRINLIYEKFGRTAQDNGLAYFRYCMEKLPPEERNRHFYVIDRGSADYRYVAEYDPQVIQFMSVKHMLYAMAAKVCVSTDSVQHLYAWRTKPSFVFSRIEKKDVFFLQHGVTAMKRVDHLFGKHGARPMKYFAVTSELEKKIVVENFGYEEENVPVTGFTRWDVLEDKSPAGSAGKSADGIADKCADCEKTILIMPTWRVWLEEASDEEFRRSDYFRSYQSLLNSGRFADMLERSNLKAVFYLHPKFASYIRDFSSGLSERIQLVPFGEEPLNEIMMRSSAQITDYSSTCWDMLYMDKPVIFWHFDLDRYMSEHGSYIDLEHDLPGACVSDESSLLDELEKLIGADYRMSPEHERMLERFYAYRDRHNCERTYEFLKSRGK